VMMAMTRMQGLLDLMLSCKNVVVDCFQVDRLACHQRNDRGAVGSCVGGVLRIKCQVWSRQASLAG